MTPERQRAYLTRELLRYFTRLSTTDITVDNTSEEEVITAWVSLDPYLLELRFEASSEDEWYVFEDVASAGEEYRITIPLNPSIDRDEMVQLMKLIQVGHVCVADFDGEHQSHADIADYALQCGYLDADGDVTPAGQQWILENSDE